MGPVCIVGAGLSAADAVLSARFHSLPVVHIFRQIRITPERSLPESMYPEYHKVQEMMRARGKGYPDYTAYPGHQVECISDGKLMSVSPSGVQLGHQVSLVAVLIGSRPDLSYLAPVFQDGQALTVEPTKPLDIRANPLAVDPWTHRLVRASPGLYAVGPLSGDTFVRFLLGGVVAVTSDIHRQYFGLQSIH